MMTMILLTLSGVSIGVICMIVALILFILAALNVGSPRFSLGWAGAAFACLAFLIG